MNWTWIVIGGLTFWCVGLTSIITCLFEDLKASKEWGGNRLDRLETAFENHQGDNRKDMKKLRDKLKVCGQKVGASSVVCSTALELITPIHQRLDILELGEVSETVVIDPHQQMKTTIEKLVVATLTRRDWGGIEYLESSEQRLRALSESILITVLEEVRPDLLPVLV